ncbi:MAG: FkbM family methyltransferase [Ruegeria sp.]
MGPERPTRSFEDFFSHLNSLGFNPRTCIDVGAAEGTPSIYSAFPKAYHIAFEPLGDFLPKLEKTLAPYAHEIRRCALMDKPSERTTILRHQHLFGSSMMHQRDNDAANVEEVEVSTLDSELKNTDLSGDILLKTDCQGADLLVLKGGTEVLKKVDIAIVEASFFRFWGPHQPDFYEIIEFMKTNGFVVYDFLDGLFRPSDNALGQIDVVFVREKGALRSNPYW